MLAMHKQIILDHRIIRTFLALKCCFRDVIDASLIYGSDDGELSWQLL